jgi:hypothetical protein
MALARLVRAASAMPGRAAGPVARVPVEIILAEIVVRAPVAAIAVHAVMATGEVRV